MIFYLDLYLAITLA